MDELVVITPELKSGAGGVGDYTLRLLENWGTLENLRLLVAPAGFSEATPDAYRVDQLARNRTAILKQLPLNGGKILVQYSAYGFDRLGYPRELIHALVEWKKRTRGRLIIMFHEIWGFWPIMNKNFFVQWLHRRAIKRLVQSADIVFTTTASQLGHLRVLSTGVPMSVLPVGANIRRHITDDNSRQPGWAVIFGLQRTRLRALQKMRENLAALAAAKQITRIISAGTNSDSQLAEQERQLLAALSLTEGFEQRGAAPEEKISEVLSSASFGVFAQDELSYEKSGTFMAYAAHQLNVLAEFADLSKAQPICWLVAPPELLRGVSQAELKMRSERLRIWQEQTSSWPVIATQLAEALNLDVLRKAHI